MVVRQRLGLHMHHRTTPLSNGFESGNAVSVNGQTAKAVSI